MLLRPPNATTRATFLFLGENHTLYTPIPLENISDCALKAISDFNFIVRCSYGQWALGMFMGLALLGPPLDTPLYCRPEFRDGLHGCRCTFCVSLLRSPISVLRDVERGIFNWRMGGYLNMWTQGKYISLKFYSSSYANSNYWHWADCHSCWSQSWELPGQLACYCFHTLSCCYLWNLFKAPAIFSSQLLSTLYHYFALDY